MKKPPSPSPSQEQQERDLSQHLKVGALVYMMYSPKHCGRIIKIVKENKKWNTVRIQWAKDGTIQDITEAGLNPLIPKLKRLRADLLELIELKDKLKTFKVEQ